MSHHSDNNPHSPPTADSEASFSKHQTTPTRNISVNQTGEETEEIQPSSILETDLPLSATTSRTYSCCGTATYTFPPGTWHGTHQNENSWHQLPIMARAERNATILDDELPPIEPLPTPPPRPILIGAAASENQAPPQNRRLSNTFERMRLESGLSRPDPPSRAATESQHTAEQVIRATMFTMQYDLYQTPGGARLMMTHERPEQVEFALDALEMAPELRYPASVEETENVVWRFIYGDDVSHLL